MLINDHPSSRSSMSWDTTQTLQAWIATQQKDMEGLQRRLLDAVASSHWRNIKNLERGIGDGLGSWDDSPVAQTLKDSLLDKLAYTELSNREDRISRAFQKTFEWIFSDSVEAGKDDHSWSNFKQWLAQGSGIYWITGKAGSGKSTLMKMLYRDTRTLKLLQRWSGSTPIITASFYFWNSGTDLEMSQEGLLRSLLYQALSKRLKIYPKLRSSSKWGAFSLSIGNRTSRQYISTRPNSLPKQSLSWEQLIQAFRFLVEENAETPVNYVFFIDGLDEFSGELSGLIALVQRLVSYPNVKICTSSRPWIVFEDAFKQQPNLMLQYRTLSDIAHYANESLSANLAFQELRQYSPNYASRLIENITTKASGVFLWVVLVVRSLLEGLEQGDRPTELQRRLDHLPEELNDLFKKMLHGLTGDHFRDAAELFQIFRASGTKPSVLLMSLADDEGHNWAITRAVDPFTSKEIWYRAITMKRRLNSRCRGLLEIGPLPRQLPKNCIWTDCKLGNMTGKALGNNDLFISQNAPRSDAKDAPAITDLDVGDGHILAAASVDYLHRTVKDFLTSPWIWKHIRDASSATFSPDVSLFRAYLVLLKTVPSENLNSDLLWKHVGRCLRKAIAVASKDVKLHIHFLKATDQAASQLTAQNNSKGTTYIQQYWTSANCHWVSTASRGEKGDDFLTLAVRCNLLEYVRANFDEEPPTRELASKLLETAISSYNPHFAKTCGLEIMKDGPHPEMVELLIKNGAKLNSSMRETSKISRVGSTVLGSSSLRTLASSQDHKKRRKMSRKKIERARRLRQWNTGVDWGDRLVDEGLEGLEDDSSDSNGTTRGILDNGFF